MAWRPTEDAIEDLGQIAETGALQYGLDRATRYVDELLAVFDRIAMNPYLAQKRDASRSIVRLVRHDAHNILYTIDDEDVVILRVLHGHQDWINML